MLPNQPNSPLSVSQLNRQVKQLLETQYPAIPVQGEISTLSKPASGHLYFTLKDQNAQIRCAMFKGSLIGNRYRPKQGDEVIAYGRLSLYEGRGDYQLIVSSMQPVGAGALQAAFFQMRDRLAAEGLFETHHKQPLPQTIRTVGVVTSSTGAAFHDILTVLKRRFPAINVILYPSQVQGNEATATIVDAINMANQRNEVDVLIVGRGGGSLEDLWCFNTEPVARAIFRSHLPVISAVGHEVDVSIADFVADVRAATPSQAAELVSPDQFELMQTLDQKAAQLHKAWLNQWQQADSTLSNLRKRLKNPAEQVTAWKVTFSNLQQRLQKAIQQPLKNQQNQLNHLTHRLTRVNPQTLIHQDRQSVQHLEMRLQKSMTLSISPKRSQFQKLVATLQVLSPLSTLERGYSITRDQESRVIQSIDQVNSGDEMTSLLKDGQITSIVTKTKR
ncbi:exodeoxyribonuclease VII large subunit [Reinekea sp. G2M2-21]|uniref:exodeoxyribonuclease VII large subunit n=1 Tax=Reinekea sp. G2M2-21 TaxID=2788942 RepID=UPI0018AB2D07|nr:exodeoxyribonuclease VII large subunit [Reinekea sp. G2M2-21]